MLLGSFIFFNVPTIIANKQHTLTLCTIKIFLVGRGGDTFKPLPPPLRTTFAFTHHLFLQRSLNDPTPHYPTSSILHYLLPPLPPPPKNFDHSIHFQLVTMQKMTLLTSKAWFPLNRNATVGSYDSNMFCLTAKRSMGNYGNTFFFHKLEPTWVRLMP